MTENQMMSKEAATGPDCKNWYVLTPFGHVAADSESNAIRVIQAAGLVIASAWTVGETTKGCWAKIAVARENYFTG